MTSKKRLVMAAFATAVVGTTVGALGVTVGGPAGNSASGTTGASARSKAGAEPAADSCHLPTFGPGSNYRPRFDPSAFSANIDNPYFPLTPGTTLVYAGTSDGKPVLDIFTTTVRTKVIDGVTTRVIEDRVYLDSVLQERTTDYYAQDPCGNVWYFGEDTAILDPQGRVTETDGTWHAEVDGAEPGLFMQAQPEVGRAFRQEWYKGKAEDTFKVLQANISVKVRAGKFEHVLRTQETTSLEPDVVDNKYYAPGVGTVVETAVKGGQERLELVEVIR